MRLKNVELCMILMQGAINGGSIPSFCKFLCGCTWVIHEILSTPATLISKLASDEVKDTSEFVCIC